jgi:glycosyltransferase involved in cell wall biosynthesis
MRIGLVSFWFTRGQAFCTKAVRQIFREAGHETFVLARPDKLKKRYRNDGIWAEDGVEVASDNAIPLDEYLDWAKRNRIEVCFFDQNEQFDEIAALRRTGVTTVGRFVWEKFLESDVPRAREAFDVLYSLTACEHARYARMGLLTPRLRWGCWPELLDQEVPEKAPDEPVVFHYPAGYLEIRRAIQPTVKAFVKAKAPNARLVVKSTKPVPEKERISHPHVTYEHGDVEREEYLRHLASVDVVLSNTRWEGLGLLFYEAIALGKPLICPDFPPMNENVRDGLTGLTVACSTRKPAPSGIPAADAKVADLARAIRRLSDRRVVDAMSRATLTLRDQDYDWDRTRADYLRLLHHATSL